MGTVLAGTIIDKVSEQIHDVLQVRWVESELLDWLNEGQRAIVILKPEAKTVNAAVVLVEGTKQTIPVAGIRLHKVIRNMGTDGLTPGNVIPIVDSAVLDAMSPGWHAAASAAAVINYTHDGNDPLTFYVTPPQPAASPGYVEMAYSAIPDACVTIADAIDISDIFEAALIDYIIYRTMSKDSDYGGQDRIAAGQYQVFQQGLGLKGQVDASVAPNKNAPPLAQVENQRK